MRHFGIPQKESAACILLVCPDCGERNPESASRLRSMRTYYCTGDGCDYIFDLTPQHGDFGKSFVEACRKFYAVMSAARPRLRSGF
ncbi:MAG TPA: hypothetical protein VH206_20480 [Xanthobacteraceae bacterium]|jgi:hypothetical protein|nr:hypothetical protein [Xanthobacteraceae bacterium]